MAEKPTAIRVALSKAWPGLRYLSFGVWTAWLYLISSGSIWLSDNEFDGTYVAYLMLGMSLIGALVCLVAPIARKTFEKALLQRWVVIGSALIATLGALLIIVAGPHYFDTPFLFWPGIVLISLFSGFFVLKCGSLFGSLDSKRVLLFVLFSEIAVVLLSYFVLGNDFYAPISGGPSLSGILAITLFPLLAAWLVCLPASTDEGQLTHKTEDSTEIQLEDTEKGDSQTEGLNASVANAADASLTMPSAAKAGIPSLTRDFWKLMFMIFFITLASEMFRNYFIAVRIPTLTFLDAKIVLLLRMVFALIVLYYAFRTSRQIRFSKMLQFSLVALAVVVAFIPLFQDYNTLFGSLLGMISICMNLIIWCLLSLVVFEKQISFLVVFGFGQGILLLARAIGWLVGIGVLPAIAGTSWEPFYYWGMVILILLVTVLFFSEMHLDRVFENIARGKISLDISTQDTLSDKEHRPWRQACVRIGERAALSKREQEIFELVATGRTPKNIAKHLVLSINTVRSHIRNIYVKLDAHSHEDLIELIEKEIIKIN